MEEIWKEIYEGKYQVSNLGRVKTFYLGERMLKPKLESYGYLRIHISIKGKSINLLLHRIVAIAFIPNPENKRTVNHIDGNPLNNCVSNLEWATDKENIQHSYDKLGRNPPYKGKFGKEHNRSIGVTQFSKDGDYICSFGSSKEASRITGIQRSSIGKSCNGVQKLAGGYKWKHTKS